MVWRSQGGSLSKKKGVVRLSETRVPLKRLVLPRQSLAKDAFGLLKASQWETKGSPQSTEATWTEKCTEEKARKETPADGRAVGLTM